MERKIDGSERVKVATKEILIVLVIVFAGLLAYSFYKQQKTDLVIKVEISCRYTGVYS